MKDTLAQASGIYTTQFIQRITLFNKLITCISTTKQKKQYIMTGQYITTVVNIL